LARSSVVGVRDALITAVVSVTGRSQFSGVCFVLSDIGDKRSRYNKVSNRTKKKLYYSSRTCLRTYVI
jgi:hypothetical protein